MDMTISSDTDRSHFGSENLVGETANFLKPKSKPNNKAKQKRHRLLLSYLRSDREFYVSLFLMNDKAHCINSDIVIILSQQILDGEKLGIV